MDILTPAPDVLPAWLTEHDVDVYAEAFEQSGFFGPVSFYRNMDANWERSKDIPASLYTMPTRLPHRLARPGQLHDARARPRPWPRRCPTSAGATVVEGAGHWVQQEKPAETNAALLEFLAATR